MAERRGPATWPLAAVAGFQLLAAAAIAGVRLTSVVTKGEWVETTGFEAIGLNVIAYTEHHWPPYRDLTSHATTAIFNFGFYATFGAAARALGQLGVSPVLLLRLLTFASVIAATSGLTWWVSSRLPQTAGRDHRTLVAASMAAGVLCGPFVGWWTLTVRPDALTMVFELFGLIAATEAARGRWHWGFPTAIVLFAGAVTFKQTELAGAVAVFAAWFIGGHRRAAALGLLALAAVAALGFSLGGPFYWANVVRAAGSAPYSLAFGGRQLAIAALIGLPVFLPAALTMFERTSQRDPLLAARMMFLICGAVGIVAVSRVGGDRNYLFPSYVAGFVLTIGRQADSGRWSTRAMQLTVAALAVSSALLTSYVLLPNTFGRVSFPELDVEAARARQLAIQRADAPVLIENRMDAVPWHSGHADAESIDWIIYATAVRRGIVGSVERRILERKYAAVFTRDAFRDQLAAAGYRAVDTMRDGVTKYER